MHLTKKQVEEARNVYNLYWDSYIKGDVDSFASTLDNYFEMIGTSEIEVCHNKAEGIEFFKGQAEELIGSVEMRNREINAIPVEGMVLVNEMCDIYVLAETDWNFYSRIRISTFLRETSDGWKVVQQHGSLPDMRVQAGETLAIDKISRENIELRDAVKRRTAELESKNRELEVETALERVRASTMAMQDSDELAEVSSLLFQQLKELGVN
ncbi:MAG: nuclear transport factor 2 family protein, partial [Rhodothermaceae bacterium]|nr:nuclear transport factor 2 family protein [Rhodothermaceae bacterium]